MIFEWVKNTQERLLSPIKTITWIRVGAALILAFLVYWVFSDLEVRNRWIELTPTAYFWGITIHVAKNISGLIIPIMVNIALWIPSYYSYIFIRAVLCTEFIKLIITLAVFLLAFIKIFPLSILIMLNPYFIIVMIVLFTLNIFLIKSWKSQAIKKYFQADGTAEQALKSTTNKMVVLLIVAIIAVSSVNSNVKTVVPQNYAPMTTYDIHHKDLKYKELIQSGKLEIIYRNTPTYGVGYSAKLSADEKMLLLRMRSLDDEGKDLFIFDTASMKNIKILQTPIVEKANRTLNGYDFTHDGKYIVVGDEAKAGNTVRFQVLNIATGKPDERFRDTRKLSKIALSPYIKDIGKIEFNPSGSDFVVLMTSASILEIWDYAKGQLAFTDLLPSGIETFTWVSDKEFLLSYYKNYDNSEIDVYLYKLSDDLEGQKIKKEQMSKDMSEKTRNFLNIKTSTDGKYAASFRSNKLSANDFTINIWDIGSDKRLATISSSKRVQDIAFHPNGNNLVMLESFSDNSALISFLNIKTGKNEREIKIPPVSINWDSQTRNGHSHIKLIDNGKKMMLIGTKIHIISLE